MQRIYDQNIYNSNGRTNLIKILMKIIEYNYKKYK